MAKVNESLTSSSVNMLHWPSTYPVTAPNTAQPAMNAHTEIAKSVRAMQTSVRSDTVGWKTFVLKQTVHVGSSKSGNPLIF